MKTHNLNILLGAGALLAMAFAGGCGSNLNSDAETGAGTVPLTQAATQGIDNCVKCHGSIADIWIASRHGNSNFSPSSQHLPGESSCADCHNPLDDGSRLAAAFNSSEARRDVIGCESCHGGGQYHNGLGPIPVPEPTTETCAGCHNRDDSHRGSSNSVADKVLASKHGDPTEFTIEGGDEEHRVCQRCHSHQGALAANVYGYVGDKDTIFPIADAATGEREVSSQAPPVIPLDQLTELQCNTCHDPHNAGELRTVYDARGAQWDPNNSQDGATDQFDLCTSCHNLYNNGGAQIIASGSAASGTLPFYHDTAWFRIIASTHYDDPTTGTQDAGFRPSNTAIEGYVIRKNAANPCFDCHGHEAFTNTRPRTEGDARGMPTVYTEWASSGHAAKIFPTKLAAAAAFDPDEDGDGIKLPENAPRTTEVVDAVMSTAADDNTGANGGYTHYDWDDSATWSSCQMCHTSTGFMNYTADPVNYDPLNNDFSHLEGWVAGVSSSNQNELLYCWGCHSNASDGILRVQTAQTLGYTYNGVPVTLPDVGPSNTCVICHGGRGNNDNIRADFAADSRSGRFAGHHASTAGTVFNTTTHTGFEFDNLDYTNNTGFIHDLIGRNNDTPESGRGPCVSCHMVTDESHVFEVVEHDPATGDIALIKAQATCDQCHTDMTATTLQGFKDGFTNAGEALTALINNVTPNYLNTDIEVNFADALLVPDLEAYGSFQNWLYLTADEPGAYVHNFGYAQRLMFDSIDWLGNGALDGTIDLSAYPAAAEWYQRDGDPTNDNAVVRP